MQDCIIVSITAAAVLWLLCTEPKYWQALARFTGSVLASYLLFFYTPVTDDALVNCIRLIALTYYALGVVFGLAGLLLVGVAMLLVDPVNYPESLKKAIADGKIQYTV
jgi:Na+-transporting NADH:ubiquinone oxidoreductase subunit NqrB